MNRSWTRASKIVLLLLCAMTFILYVDRVNLSTAAGPIQKELGLSNTELGFALSAFNYTYAVFQIIGGLVGDRFGARLTLILCGAIWTVATIATGFIGGLVSLFATRLVLGIGEGMTLPAAARAITNWTAPAKRGLAQGITHSASRLANAVTPILVAFLITTFSWRISFVVLGILTSLWIVIWAWYFRDNPAKHASITKEELAELPRVGDGSGGAARVPWGLLFPRMLPTTIVYFCYGWTSWLYFSWLPTFFLHGYNLNIKNSALFSSGVFFAGVVGDTFGGVLSDQIFRRTRNLERARSNLILCSLFGSLVFLVPVLFVKDLTIMAIFLSLAFFSLESTIGPIWAVPMDVAPKYAGTASGLLNLGAAIAGILSPTVFGIIIDATGNWTLPFAGSIGLLFIGCIMTFWIKPDRKVAGSAEEFVAAVQPAD